MSDSLSLLRGGDPVAAFDRLKQEVRKSPRDARLRTFLFQMFCVFGEWPRAVTQLAVTGELDQAATPMVQAYRAAIRCEIMRERVFAGKRVPTIFGDPADWMSRLIEANRLLSEGHAEQAAGLRDEAFEAAPGVSGSIDDVRFEWIADADPRFGPMLEALIDGKYCWVPFSTISRIDIDPPEDLRDCVWMPAHFVWTNQGETLGFIPTRYPGSEVNSELAMARRTEWQDRGHDWFTGLGQRMFATDAGEYAVMDTRRILFDPPDA
ncbi:MAG: type VI secretion system accessory protein TagJ [Acetobacteraceae bacterium]